MPPKDQNQIEQSSNLLKMEVPTPGSVSWTPLKGGGTNFRTHTLERISDKKMEFRPSISTKLLCASFIGMGLFIPIYHHAVEDIIASSMGPFAKSLIAIGIGLILIWAGFKFWHILGGLCTFDKSKGRFTNNGRDYNVASLDEVYAIQILREKLKDSDNDLGSSMQKTAFISYELNLVMRDGKRLPVVDHSAREKIREDSETLSEFLGVPVWDRK